MDFQNPWRGQIGEGAARSAARAAAGLAGFKALPLAIFVRRLRLLVNLSSVCVPPTAHIKTRVEIYLFHPSEGKTAHNSLGSGHGILNATSIKDVRCIKWNRFYR